MMFALIVVAAFLLTLVMLVAGVQWFDDESNTNAVVAIVCAFAIVVLALVLQEHYTVVRVTAPVPAERG